VWRIDGPGFRLGRLQRIGEPVANRIWGRAQSLLPRVTHGLAGLLGRRRRGGAATFDPAPPDDAFTVTAADPASAADAGTGLLAAVHVPGA
jgi:hypothetical protein